MHKTMFILAKQLLFLVLIVTLLTGCAGFGANTKKEPVTLKFAYIDKAADYAPLVEEFTRKYPNITIELKPTKAEFGRLDQAMQSLADDADAMRVPASAVSTEMAAELLTLDTQITTSTDFPTQDLLPGSLDAMKLDGKQVGLPAGISPMVVFYLPQKFSAAGIQPPPANWTLEDFVTTATALNNTDSNLRGTAKFTYGYCSHPTFPDVAIFTYLFGGGLLDSLTQISQPTLNQKANVDALSWYVSLRDDFGLMPPSGSQREVGTLVARGNCGMWIDWMDRSIYGQFTAEEPMPLPLPAYHSQFNVANLDGYVVLAKSEHPEEAWAWINFLMQQQSASGGMIPPLKSEIDSVGYANRAPKATLAVARSLPEGTVMLGLEMYRNQRFGGVIELFAQAAAEAFSGKSNVKTALDNAQTQAQQQFK